MYHATSCAIAKEYDRLEEKDLMEPIVLRSIESDFKNVLLTVLEQNLDYTMLLSDGDVFTRPFNADCISVFRNKDVISFNPRLGKNITNIPCLWRPPYYLIEWKSYYPDVFDFHGNIYRTEDLRRWLHNMDFCDQYTMIDMLSNTKGNYKPLLGMYNQSCIVTNYNLCDNSEASNNKKINHSPYMFLENDTTDVDIPYDYIWEN
jgi:hypothetical protein